MKRIFSLMLVIGLYGWTAYAAFPASGTSQDAYCFIPPYLTQTVKPNITLVMDVSGSMAFPAYMSGNPSGGSYSGYIWNVGTRTLTGAELYSSARDYYGYFDKTKYYKYNASGYFEDNSAACTSFTNRIGNTTGGTLSTGCVSGNLLNWIITTRQDTVRKILTGGRVKSGSVTATTAVLESDGSPYVFTDTNLHCKFTVTATNNATGTNSNTYAVTRKIKIEHQTSNTCVLGVLAESLTNVLTPRENVDGIIQGLYNQAVLQVSFFGESDSMFRYAKGQPVANYVAAINGELSYGGTPTGTGMAQAKYFYQQSTDLSATNETAVLHKGYYDKDPYYDSDGAPTPSSLPVPCRKSFVLLISDGMWPTGSFSAVNNSPEDPLQYAYTMRTTDMRTEAALPDSQNVTTYVVYAYGDGEYGRNSLIGTAIFGGFEDKYGAHSTTSTTTAANGWPYPFTAKPTDSRSTSTTGNTTPYALSLCNPSGTWHQECSEWDKDKTGLPYNYFEGDDGEALQLSITKAVNDMLTRASSGTAASMLSNSDSSGAVMMQALFFPERQFTDSTKAGWLGDVQAFWYYVDSGLDSSKVTLREDTVKDNKLKKTDDRIARFFFNGSSTKVKLFNDTNGDGVEDDLSTYVEENTDEVKALWRAGLSLWSRMPSGTDGRTVYTNNLNGTATSNNLMGFSSDNVTALKPYLDVNSVEADATNIINYTRGIDPVHVDLASDEEDSALVGYRSRTVKIGTATHTWKLGDIINSTPKMISPSPLNSYSANPPAGYRDKSYEKYVSTISYKNRGVAFVGGNDGMLHAFKLGKNIPGTAGYVSQLVDSTNLNGTNPVAATDLGKELWAYIPKNVLPYLKHRGNPNYAHLYYVDSTPLIIDASIAVVENKCSNDAFKSCSTATDCAPSGATCDPISPACTGSNCPKLSGSWKTVLIGSMGLGGATRNLGTTCTDCVKTPVDGVGYSSYFALDVTDVTAPKLLWEFSDPGLGYSTVGPAIVRVKDSTDTSDVPKNGKYYVVLASGPTGPINQGIKQMKAYSDQPLNIYILDLKTGQAVKTFSNSATTLITGVSHTQFSAMPDLAFGGAFTNSTIDTDKSNAMRIGNYSDDAIYLGYVRKDITNGSPSLGKFAKGGVLRILTGETTPNSWIVSTVIDGIGPVTSAIAKLQDVKNKSLWLYFGTGRYFYKDGSLVDEDFTGQNEALYGLKEPCYSSLADVGENNDVGIVVGNDLNKECTTSLALTDIKDQTSTIASTLSSTHKGWKINLGVATGTFKAKRVYTNPTVSGNGVVFFTTFKPSSAVCSYGGDTSLWALNYSTGGSVGGRNLRGQAVLQLATGELKQIDLKTSFTESKGDGTYGRETTSFTGPPPRDETQITSNANHAPSKKILHIMER